MRVRLSTPTPRRSEQGAVAIITAFLLMPFLILAAFVLDFGSSYAQSRAYSAGADSATLAMINEARVEGSKVNAKTCAQFRTAFDAKYPSAASRKGFAAQLAALNAPTTRTVTAADISTASVSCQNASTLRANVAIDAEVATSLGSIVGVPSITAGRAAEAVMGLGGASACGLCIVGDGNHDLQNGDIEAAGTSVSINGTLVSNPQGSVIITSGGSISLQGSKPSKGTFDPAPAVGQPPVSDPFAGLPLPDPATMGLLPGTNSCTGGPGRVYAAIAPCSSMAPGLYVFTGTTSLNGNDVVKATGVTMYFVCGTPSAPRRCAEGEDGGEITSAGNAALTISAPLTSPWTGMPAGFALVADKNNSSTFSFRGNGAAGSTGTIYALSGTLNYRGNGAGDTLDSLVVVGDIDFSGTPSTFKLKYNAANNASLPPAPSRLTE